MFVMLKIWYCLCTLKNKFAILVSSTNIFEKTKNVLSEQVFAIIFTQSNF